MVAAAAPAPSVQQAQPHWMILAEQGLAAQTAGDYIVAQERYEASLAENADNADVVHMLGVVHTQRYNPVDGLKLILRAADMVAWELPSFRHNVGYTLSAFLSSRPPKSLKARSALLRELRTQRLDKFNGAPSPSVGALVIGANADTTHELLHTLAAQTHPLDEIAVAVESHALQSIERQLSVLFPTAKRHAIARSTERKADVARLLALMSTDWIQPAYDDVGYSATRIERMLCDVRGAGALWGVSLASQTDVAAGREHPVLALLNGLTRLLPRARVGDLFLDRLGLAITPSNFFFQRSLFACVLADPQLLDFEATGLGLVSVWHDEPIISLEKTFHVSSRTLDNVSQQLVTAHTLRQIDVIVDRMLRVTSPPNPLATNSRDDGIDFLKRSLRDSLGAKLSPPTLKHVVRLVEQVVDDEPLREHGIEYVGFARAESGLGENLRALVRATQTAGIPVSVSDVDIDSGIRNADSSVDAFIGVAPYKTRIICVNPDLLGEAFRDDGFLRARDAYRIGFWFWELERLPRNWIDTARLVDEIWVATQFVADAVKRDIRDRPIHKVRTPVQKPILSRTYRRDEFGLHEGACLFMFSFAYGSFATRKNPEAVIRAFRIAFPLGSEDVQLVIKSSQSDLFPEHRARLHALANGDDRIVFLDKYLSRDAVYGLQSCCDAYVSLHRSEGLGLGLAECMAQGKPVIATNYSGNCEFMDSENSLLVDYRLVPVRDGEYSDWKNQVWADADVEHAAQHMRKIFDDRAYALRVGQKAAQHLTEFFSYSVIGETVKARFDSIQGR